MLRRPDRCTADQRHLQLPRTWAPTSARGPWPCTATGSTSATSDTGEGLGPGVPAADAGRRGLRFFVASKTVASAQRGTRNWRTDLNGPLGYPKGNNITGWGTCGNNCPPQTRRWNTWTDQWTWTGANAGTVGFQGYSPTQMYPQAILGSLAFDASGRMILGFVDRTSVQGGNRQLGIDPTDDKFYETVSSAEMLIAAPPDGAGGRLRARVQRFRRRGRRRRGRQQPRSGRWGVLPRLRKAPTPRDRTTSRTPRAAWSPTRASRRRRPPRWTR